MKTKHFLYGGIGIGLIAGLLRLLQYILVIDQQGFYRVGNLTSLLNGCLIGILFFGCVWSFLSKSHQKELRSLGFGAFL